MELVLDHVVLEVREPAASAAFYVELLGLEPVRLEAFAAGEARFPSLRLAPGTILDLFPPAMWRGPTHHNPNHLCLATTAEGLEAVRARLAARGIPLTRTDDHNFGARGYGRSLYFDDPDGISIEVRCYP